MKTLIFMCFISVWSVVPAIASDIVRIHCDIPGDSAYVDSVYQVTRQRLIRLLDYIPDDTLDIFIVSSIKRFDSLAGDFVPDWGAGVAILYKKRIVIKSPLILPGHKTLGELVAHEYTHIALGRRVHYRPVPRWMNEGMAMYLSAEWDWMDNLTLGTLILFGYRVDLADIETLNRFNDNRAKAAYAESYQAFDYFLDTYGQSGLRIFLDNCARKSSFNRAFLMATGADYASFEKEFDKFLAWRYNVIALIFNSNILWLFLALIIIIGFIVTRIRRKSRLKQLDEYDRLHSTDFDYGEVEKPDEDNPWD